MKFFVTYIFTKGNQKYKKEAMIEAKSRDELKELLYEEAINDGVESLDIISAVPVAILKDEQMVSEYEFEVEKTILGYKLKWNGIIFNVQNIKLKKDECVFHLEITTSIPVASTEIIWQGKYNLFSERTTSELIKKCDEILPEKEAGINWKTVIQLWKRRLYELIKEGEPVEEIHLADIEEQTFSFLIEPFIIKDTINLLFGEGGVGKSSFALMLANLGYSNELKKQVQLNSLPLSVLYLDYEHNKIVFKNFLKLLRETYGIDAAIKYRQCMMPLQAEFDSIATIVSEHKPDLIIIDSLAPAVGDVVEVTNIVSFYQYLQQLRTTILLLGHTPKLKENETVFGSVFFTNLARNVWLIKKKILSSNSFQTILMHKKTNITSLHTKPVAFTFTYQDGGISIDRAEPELEELSTHQQIQKLLLDKGAMTPKEISEELGISHNTVKVTLIRMVEKGILIKLDDKKSTLYAIKSHEPF